ncbi:sensor histidine kinase [Raphidiopsis sp. BLCC-F218]
MQSKPWKKIRVFLPINHLLNHTSTRILNYLSNHLFNIYQKQILGYLGIFNLLSITYLIVNSDYLNFPVLAVYIIIANLLELIILQHKDQNLKSEVKSRQTIIEIIFETIHNGPLQTLDRILRIVNHVNQQEFSSDTLMKTTIPELTTELEKLNQELRGIYEFWHRETISPHANLYLDKNLVINLEAPLPEILYQVYTHTLERNFSCFQTIKLKVRSFDPLDETGLTVEHKRGICRFLEESLCNVGKYATGLTCLKVSGLSYMGWYTLSIIDDGLGVNSCKEGEGTKQFKYLAQQLQGKFQRIPQHPQGTICELSWPTSSVVKNHQT